MKLKGFLVILILGVAVLTILCKMKSEGEGGGLPEKIQAVDTAREQSTQINMRALQQEIIGYIAVHGRAPESLEQLPPTSKIIAENPDAWGTPIRYRRISDESFQLISAGKDKEFDTPDDVVLEY